jgi:hypothetical protein
MSGGEVGGEGGMVSVVSGGWVSEEWWWWEAE